MRIEQTLEAIKQYSISHLSGASLKYLKGRGLADPIIKEFELGYFPTYQEQEFDACEFRWLEYHKLVGKDRNGKLRCPFEGRITIPVYNAYGQLVAIQARKVAEIPELQPYNDRKYWHNSFAKSRVLFNLHRAIPVVRKTGKIIISEGQFDVCMAKQFKISNCVCTSGTAVNSLHINLLARYATDVLIIFDNDKAGQKAAERLKRKNYVGLNLKFITLPSENGEKQDLDSFLRQKGRQALLDVVTGKTEDDELRSSLDRL